MSIACVTIGDFMMFSSTLNSRVAETRCPIKPDLRQKRNSDVRTSRWNMRELNHKPKGSRKCRAKQRPRCVFRCFEYSWFIPQLVSSTKISLPLNNEDGVVWSDLTDSSAVATDIGIELSSDWRPLKTFLRIDGCCTLIWFCPLGQTFKSLFFYYYYDSSLLFSCSIDSPVQDEADSRVSPVFSYASLH